MVRSHPRCERMNLALIAMICNQVHAAEDAAMQVIHDAMRSKRTVFGHSLRDTYVRATPLLLTMVAGGGRCLRDVCTMVFTGRFQGHGPGRLWAAITSGIRRGIQAAGPGIERGAGRGSVSCGGRGRVRLRLALCTLSRRRFHTRMLLSIGAGRSAMRSSRRSCGTSMGAGRGAEVPRGDKKLTSA